MWPILAGRRNWWKYQGTCLVLVSLFASSKLYSLEKSIWVRLLILCLNLLLGGIKALLSFPQVWRKHIFLCHQGHMVIKLLQCGIKNLESYIIFCALFSFINIPKNNIIVIVKIKLILLVGLIILYHPISIII